MTLYDTMDLYIVSPTYDIEAQPDSIKNTHRFLLKIVHGNYNCDVDLAFTLYYCRFKDLREETWTYTISKNAVYFKEKLPKGILCRRFRYEITGKASKAWMFESFGVNAAIVPVGIK